MNAPSASELQAFIAGYTAADEARIRFDPDLDLDAEPNPKNALFRDYVCEEALEDLQRAPLELIRDLYLAETRSSVATWGIRDGVGELAEALLRRGGETYLDDYLEGKFQSMDAHMGTVFPYDFELGTRLLAAVRRRLHAEPDSPQADLWREGEKLFRGWTESTM